MKKRLLFSLCLAAAAVAAFCLWYTRPVSFWESTGMDRDEITGASGYAIESFVTDGTARQQTWMLDSLTPGQEEYETLLALLEDTTYRASLQNLLPASSSHFADNITSTASFALGDELVTVNAYHAGKVRIFSSQRERSLFFSVFPRELNETLADFIQQHGMLENP